MKSVDTLKGAVSFLCKDEIHGNVGAAWDLMDAIDELAHLREANAEAELTQAVEDRSNAVEIAHTEQGNTIRAERERDAAIKRAEAAEARVKELEALASSACAHAMNANLSWSKSDDLSVRLRAALEKCVEALGVATTPLARDRLTVLDALRAASDARAEI